jgi:hypothetical protein
MNPLQLFRSGMDYISIASHLNTTEAEVERQIHRLRNKERETACIQAKNARIRSELREIRARHAV